MVELSVGRYVQALTDQAAELAALVDGAQLGQTVPSCPEWSLRRLVEHVGQAHRSAAALVARRAGGPEAASDSRGQPMPGSEGVPDGWLTQGAAELVVAVREVGPEYPMWTFAGPHRAAFWLRRMAHETAVHRADAALNLGAPFVLETDLAADAVTEHWLGNLTF